MKKLMVVICLALCSCESHQTSMGTAVSSIQIQIKGEDGVIRWVCMRPTQYNFTIWYPDDTGKCFKAAR